MSSDPPASLYPVLVVQDRYQGIYSRGRWWAVAHGDEPFEGTTRIAWLMDTGPCGDDVTAAVFWQYAPPWIAVGPTPDAAVAKLVARPEAASDDWSPPPIEADPRWREKFRRSD
jgi:hypothetical protein